MMKRTMGGVLAAAMMMMSALPAAGAVDVSHLNGTGSSTLTQAAADTLPSLSIAPMTELATVVSYENGDLTVKTADGDELVLHTENAIVMDTQTAAAADLSALKAGESVYVYHDEAVTMSLPAQTTAYAVLTNLTDKHAPASLLTAEAVQKNDDGSVTVTCQSGALHLTIAKDASVQPFMTRNIVTVDDIHVGTVSLHGSTSLLLLTRHRPLPTALSSRARRTAVSSFSLRMARS